MKASECRFSHELIEPDGQHWTLQFEMNLRGGNRKRKAIPVNKIDEVNAKLPKEAKAAAEFEDKFSARAAFPAAELAKAEGNEGASAAREARIEARRQERIAERQVARAAARV